MVILSFICEIPTMIHTCLINFQKVHMALGTLCMAEVWKCGSQFAGKPHVVLKWTGYQSNLIGKAVGSRKQMQKWVSPNLLQTDTARFCTFH